MARWHSRAISSEEWAGKAHRDRGDRPALSAEFEFEVGLSARQRGTNTKQAYFAGQDNTLSRPAVQNEFPFVKYVATRDGRITSWLNELAFVPVDYREDGPIDEWSGDRGCGVQYFSQQAVARLAPLAGFEFPIDMPFPEQLASVQQHMEQGDDRARQIFKTIGCYFGYTVAWFQEFYDFRHLLILGRVTSGEGGEIIIERGETILRDEFPELAERVQMTTPDEQFKRHGQAIAAASLPAIGG